MLQWNSDKIQRKGHKMKKCMVIMLFLLHNTTVDALTDVSVPEGTDIVLSPSTNVTWWRTDDKGKEELVKVNNGLARIDRNGYLRITANITAQGGTYRQVLYNKVTNSPMETDIFPKLRLYDVDMEELNCSHKHGHAEILVQEKKEGCIDDLTYYLAAHNASKTGLFHCAHTGPKFDVLTTGTDIVFIPSTTATWWVSANGGDSVPVSYVQSNTWVDEYGRLRVHFDNSINYRHYGLTFYSKSEELQWYAKPLPSLSLDPESAPSNQTVAVNSGESLMMKCSIFYERHGRNIVWYRDSTEVGTGWTLHIKNCKVYHSGIYICLKDDEIGQAINAVVIETRISSRIIYIEVGQSTMLNCQLQSSGMDIKWYKDKTTTTIGTGTTFMIQNFMNLLAGDYVCSSGNKRQTFTVFLNESQQEMSSSGRSSFEVSFGVVFTVIVLLLVIAGVSWWYYKFRGRDSEQVSLDQMAEKLRCQYRERMSEWYKPALNLSAPDGQPIYVSPVLLAKNNKSEIQKNNIMDVTQSLQSGSHVVIAADAGYGKSALLNYLCRLWLSKDGAMSKYKLLLYMALRNVKSKTIEGILCNDIALVNQRDYPQLKKLLKSQDVLWLLDSYEELNPDLYDEDIDKLIKGKLYTDPNTLVVVTTRPHCTQLVLSGDIKSHICLYSIQDFSSDNCMKYINNVEVSLQNAEHSKSIDKLKSLIEDIPIALLSVPLFLALICSQWYEENVDVYANMINTKTKLLNVLLQKSIQESRQKHIKKAQILPMVQCNPLERTVDEEIRKKLKKLAKACFLVLTENKRYLDEADLKAVGTTIGEIDELGIRNLINITVSNQVTFPHSLIQEYLAGIHLVSSEDAKRGLFDDMKAKIPGSNLLLNEICENYWQVIIFSVGLQPSQKGKQSFLSQFTLECVQYVHNFHAGFDYIDLSCESELYDECSSENDRGQFVSHLDICDLVPSTSSSDKRELPFPLLNSLVKEGTVTKWGEKLDLCQNEGGKAILSGSEIHIKGAVLAELLNISQIINVGYIDMWFCRVELENMTKLTQKESRLCLHSCNVVPPDPEITITCPNIKIVEIEDCSLYPLSALLSCLTGLKSLKVKNMTNLFTEQKAAPSDLKVCKIALNNCGRVNVSNFVCWCPALETLSLRSCVMSRSVRSPYKLNNLETLIIHNITHVNLLCDICPNLKTLVIVVGIKGENTPLSDLVECLRRITGDSPIEEGSMDRKNKEITDSAETEQFLSHSMHVIVLYDSYFGTADYSWVKSCQWDNVKPLPNVISYTTCKLIDGEEKKAIRKLFPKAEITAMIKQDLVYLLGNLNMQIGWDVWWEMWERDLLPDKTIYMDTHF